MGYNWQEEASGEGSADKLPNGVHFVTGSKVILGKGSKGPWVLLVFEDKEAREGSTVLSLSDKGSWTLARWLSRCGSDLKAMESESIEPKHFVNKDIAEGYLLGSSCWVLIEDGKDPQYKNVTPLTEAEAVEKGAKVAERPAVGSDFPTDSIPF